MTCDKCQRDIQIGDFQFCPHGRSSAIVIGDDIPGGFRQENFGHQPEVFYSKKAMLKRADDLGLQPMIRNAGPHDRHVPRWVSVDLDAATALVSRSAPASKTEEIVCETAQITVAVR